MIIHRPVHNSQQIYIDISIDGNGEAKFLLDGFYVLSKKLKLYKGEYEYDNYTFVYDPTSGDRYRLLPVVQGMIAYDVFSVFSYKKSAPANVNEEISLICLDILKSPEAVAYIRSIRYDDRITDDTYSGSGPDDQLKFDISGIHLDDFVSMTKDHELFSYLNKSLEASENIVLLRHDGGTVFYDGEYYVPMTSDQFETFKAEFTAAKARSMSTKLSRAASRLI